VSSVPNTTSPDAEHGNPSSENSARSSPIALEVEVSVTGARADAVARELFTEETKTVLVFRDGAVIRLNAPVAPGQLLFVTDKKSSAEVVCQVLNTRPCNETSRYVDVQFTEEKPTFWDVAFPSGNKVAPEFSVKQHLEAEAQTTGSAPTAAVEPHKAEDVDQLRKEVEALRKQLLELSQKAAAPPSNQDDASASSPAEPPPRDASTAKLDESRDAPWIKALTETQAASPPEAPLMPAAGETMKQQAPRPVIGMSLPIRVADEGAPVSEPANGPKNESVDPSEALLPAPSLDFSKMPSSSPYVPTGYGLLRRPSTWTPQRLMALGVFLVVTLTVSLWLGKPWRYFLSKKSVEVSAPSNPANSAPTTPSAVAPSTSTAPATVLKTSAKPHESKNISEAPANAASHSAKDDASGENESSAAGGTERQSSKKSLVAATGKARTKVTAPETTPATADANSASEPVIPPKLLRAATPVYPPDAMLNFVTGDVRAEALVGADGQVTEVHVLSGPKAFQEAAIDALKHYEYAPATQGGKPVPSKVTVTVKFWFDP
jgi:periplasmic protein TonB